MKRSGDGNTLFTHISSSVSNFHKGFQPVVSNSLTNIIFLQHFFNGTHFLGAVPICSSSINGIMPYDANAAATSKIKSCSEYFQSIKCHTPKTIIHSAVEVFKTFESHFSCVSRSSSSTSGLSSKY